jgi:ketosteroid isomerase-like protein
VSEQANREVIERWARALTEGDLELLDAQFHEDAVIEYPQSGERIVGGENRGAVYAAFPGLPKVDVRRLTFGGDLAFVEARFDYGDDVDWRVAIVLQIRDGKIAREMAYWGQPVEAADWRAAWVERSEV